MSHPFWRDQFFKIIIPIVLLGSEVFAVENIPGLLSSLLELQKTQENQYGKYLKELEKNDLKSEFNRAKEVRLDPFFLRSLVFYSNRIYFSLLAGNPCSLYALIENNLVKTSETKLQNIGVIFKTRDGRLISALIDKKTFLNFIYNKDCPILKDLPILFSPKNFSQTFKKTALSRPKNYSICLDQIKKLKSAKDTPYLCRIPKSIKEGKIAENLLSSIKTNEDKRMLNLSRMVREKNFYLKHTTLFDQNYLKHLCENLDNPDNFCNFFQADDAWSKVIFGDLPPFKLDYKCMEYLNIKNLPSKNQLNTCAEKFKEKPRLCETLSWGYSLFPSYSCDTLSKILKVNRLKTRYRDCPALVDNDSFTNLFRIYEHFLERKNQTLDSSTCLNNSYQNAINVLSSNRENFSNWPLKMCYTDPKINKEACLPYTPGTDNNNPVSETRVLNQILQITKNADRKEYCDIVSEKNYNPVKLEYRNTCYIIYDPGLCASHYCPKKILYRNEEQKNIRYEGIGVIDYFTNQPGKSLETLVASLKRVLNVTYQEIRSLSELVRFFTKNSQGIAHGIGCLEDFYPYLFRKNSLNECRPIPFIVDGFLKDNNGKVWIIFRSTIDDVHAPHLIHWNDLYSGLKSYEDIHPLKTWTFYGIEK